MLIFVVVGFTPRLESLSIPSYWGGGFRVVASVHLVGFAVFGMAREGGGVAVWRRAYLQPFTSSGHRVSRWRCFGLQH